MSRWQSRVDDLLYDGETVRETIDIEASRVVVTSHRVLVFTPEMDGENFRYADRPNITGVGTDALGHDSFLRRGLTLATVGLLLLVAGVLFDPDSLFGDDLVVETDTADDFGLGGLMEMTHAMFALLLNLDSILRTFGVLALVLAGVVLGVYWYFRTPTLAIRQAGSRDDLHVPRPENAGDLANRLELAILPDAHGEKSTKPTVNDDLSSSGGDGFLDDTPDTRSEPSEHAAMPGETGSNTDADAGTEANAQADTQPGADER